MHVVGAWPGQQLHGAPLCSRTPFARPSPARRRFSVVAASGPEETSTEERPAAVRKRKKTQQKEDANTDFTLEDINPISIGRRSRQVFDTVWQQFQKLSSPTKSTALTMEDFDMAGRSEFSSPQASFTTVLVCGATGRVGRVLVRKLLLRGYKVRALVRKRESTLADAIPPAVEVVSGDIGDPAACKTAVKGVDKVIFCTAARTTLTGDLSRVEEQGVANVIKSLEDAMNAKARRNRNRISARAKREIADFGRERYQDAWRVEQLGLPASASNLSRRVFDRGQDVASVNISEEGNLVFAGTVYSRGGTAEAGGAVELPHGDSMAGSEGLVLRILGDMQPYTLIVRTGDGREYTSRVQTRHGYATVRVPFNSFRSVEPGAPPLDPADAARLSVRYEPRSRVAATIIGQEDSAPQNDFKLEIDWIKALPPGEETDIVLISCVGATFTGAEREKVAQAKRRGEEVVRATGLGYTIVRPGPLQEEPGGYKALVFDQGNRITEPISIADVADVALKALHDPLARNKTFEVCQEYAAAGGLEMYELVAHLPDRNNNYLSPALATLEKNT